MSPTSKKGQALSGIDKSFFHVEDSNHLMTVASCSIFHDNMNIEDIKIPLQTMANQFPRFRQRVTKPTTFTKERYWEDYPFDLDQHITEIHLPSASEASSSSDDEYPPELRETLSTLISKPFNDSIALWQCEIIHYQSNRTALFVRVHHCITDGQGAIRCLLSVTNNSNSTELQYGKHEETAQLASSWKQYIQFAFQFVIFALQFIWGAILGWWHFFFVLFVFKRNHFRSQLTKDKIISFSDAVKLDDVKEIKNHFGVSVNDVLISSLAGSFREYIINTEGKVLDNDLLSYIPVSMRKADDWDLGNKISIVWARLPLDIEDPVERLMEVSKRMAKIKNSKEPLATYFFMELLGNSPYADHAISKWLLRQLMRKPHAVFTNVPGPKIPLVFAGKPIKSFFPFVPQPGDGGVGIALLSYSENVSCSLTVDRNLLKDGGSSITSGLLTHIKELQNLLPAQ